MFAKKNMIVIAIIAIFVMGVVALQAGTIHVFANRDAIDGWYSMDFATGGYQIDYLWEQGLNYVRNFASADVFRCWGQSSLGSDYDWGTVIPIHNYVFHLDLSGLEQIPDPEPETE